MSPPAPAPAPLPALAPPAPEGPAPAKTPSRDRPPRRSAAPDADPAAAAVDEGVGSPKRSLLGAWLAPWVVGGWEKDGPSRRLEDAADGGVVLAVEEEGAAEADGSEMSMRSGAREAEWEE